MQERRPSESAKVQLILDIYSRKIVGWEGAT
jgi:hypothetical protein